MTALTVTAKGQITLRRELLQYLGIAPGQQVEVDRPSQGLKAFVGCLPPPATALSVKDMNQIIATCWAGRK
jgi:bifunctional DNA-binding transcriptional regulator/antitoxin component of YhaV-PrlF toxin-antitoxin module